MHDFPGFNVLSRKLVIVPRVCAFFGSVSTYYISKTSNLKSNCSVGPLHAKVPCFGFLLLLLSVFCIQMALFWFAAACMALILQCLIADFWYFCFFPRVEKAQVYLVLFIRIMFLNMRWDGLHIDLVMCCFQHPASILMDMQGTSI